jgi:hypothetical protein
MVDKPDRSDHTTTAGHDPEAEHESHPLPMGALLMILAYLVLLTLLWVQVYLQMLNSGGIPRT